MIVTWHHQLSGLELGQTLEMVKDREAWHAVVYGVARVRHNLVTEQPPFRYSTYFFIALFVFYNKLHKLFVGRRQWRHTPVLLSGESHGWRSLVG